MRLITVEQWLAKYFADGSHPSMQMIRRCLRNRSIPGRKVGGTWFINEFAWLAHGNERVAHILAA